MRILGGVIGETRVKNFGAPSEGFKAVEGNILYQLALNPRIVQKIPNSL